jgi:hypothetical protein
MAADSYRSHKRGVEDEMKRFTLVLLSMVTTVFCTVVGLAQSNPRGTSAITLKGKTVSVEYGRPSLKGRTTNDLLGKLPPEGVWRLGADASTTFKTDTDLDFVDAVVPAGIYSLWLAKASGDNSWNLVFNKQHGQWGTEHDASQDAYFVPLKSSKAAKSIEMVTLTLSRAGDAGKFRIQWGTLEVAANFKAK